MSAVALAFEDSPKVKNADDYYAVPNEDISLWRDYLKGKRIERAAGICSSGEIGLFAMLPTVRKELVLVDHSYRSLSIAMLKWLLLRERGPEATYELLLTKQPKEVKAVLGEVRAGLPDAVRRVYDSMYEEERNSYYTQYEPFSSYSSSMKLYWSRLPMRLIRHSGTKLGKVRFLHGDMKDLAAQGLKFDALYLSNALEHYYSQTSARTACTTLDTILNPGAYIMAAVQNRDGYRCRPVFKEMKWEVVEDKQSKRSSINWRQLLLRKPDAS